MTDPRPPTTDRKRALYILGEATRRRLTLDEYEEVRAYVRWLETLR